MRTRRFYEAMGFVYVHAEHFPADPKDIINMTVDISERKKAELALAERNAQLARLERSLSWAATRTMSTQTGCGSRKGMQLYTACPRDNRDDT